MIGYLTSKCPSNFKIFTSAFLILFSVTFETVTTIPLESRKRYDSNLSHTIIFVMLLEFRRSLLSGYRGASSGSGTVTNQN